MLRYGTWRYSSKIKIRVSTESWWHVNFVLEDASLERILLIARRWTSKIEFLFKENAILDTVIELCNVKSTLESLSLSRWSSRLGSVSRNSDEIGCLIVSIHLQTLRWFFSLRRLILSLVLLFERTRLIMFRCDVCRLGRNLAIWTGVLRYSQRRRRSHVVYIRN